MIYPWQSNQWQHFSDLVTGQCLPHALLLTGKQGMGKGDYARAVASALLCNQTDDQGQACGHCASCQLIRAGTHPDFHFVEPAAPENSKSKRPVTSIKIDAIRELCSSLSKTSQYEGYRVAVVYQADKMTTSAANSLLKTLEEPGAQVMIILVSSHPDRLPATIRSRCQQVRFSEPPIAQAIDWMSTQLDQAASSEQLAQWLRHAHGSPLLAVRLIEHSDFYQLIDEAMLSKLQQAQSDVLDIASRLSNYDKNHVLEAILDWVSDVIRLQITTSDNTSGGGLVNVACQPQMQTISQRTSAQRLYWFRDQVLERISYSAIAVNEQLMWENLLLSWKHL